MHYAAAVIATAHRGLVFFTSSPDPLALPSRPQHLDAGQIWIPG